jgi:hypothetical protein
MDRLEMQSRAISIIEQLGETNARLREMARRKGELETAYRQKRATELIIASDLKSAELRNAQADQQASLQMKDYKICAAELDVEVEIARNLRGSLSAIQTLLSVERAEADAVRYGQGAGA